MWVVENITDSFTTAHKREIVDILHYKIMINDKWIRLNDAIEDIVDSYIAFLEERSNTVLTVTYFRRIQTEGWRRTDL